MISEMSPLREAPTERNIPHANSEYEAEDRELREALAYIWNIADEFHLDPFPTHFEVVPSKVLNEMGAYCIPGHFSHWTYGRQYRQNKTMYDWGFGKVYEQVINSNPAQAFLLENNPPIENKFVMAHVLGHTDFFKNNQLFATTRRDMPEAAARSAARIHGYEEVVGKLAVEHILDATLALQGHIDPLMPNRPSQEEELRMWREQNTNDQKATSVLSNEFDDLFGPVKSNSEAREPRDKEPLHIPPEPDCDILGFIRNHAPYLEDWERDIVDVVRSESVYFYPQMRTKIMNEGWAAYWHKRIMREMSDRNLISDKENEAWWLVHSGVVAPSKKSLNPYYLGMKMYEYLEDYYNGNLSDEEQVWLRKEGTPVYPHFEGDLKDSPATPMLRDVMMHNDDQSFVRNYFDKNVADRMNMFIAEERTTYDGSLITVVKEKGWQEIRDKLVRSMNNCGRPYIVVVDGNHNRSGELYLRHEFDGLPLDPEYSKKMLPHIYTLWQRPVHLETVNSKTKKKIVYSHDSTKTTVN